MTDPTISAALIQLAEHGERIAVLHDRETSHFTAVNERLDAIAAVIDNLGAAVKDQAAIIASLAGLDEKVAALAAAVGRATPDGEAVSYQPAPAPRWWKLAGEEREQAIARLRAWVEQVYRPGYGQLAAALGPCWGQHPLCLYGLDVLAELWSILYLQPTRTAPVVSAQAEYQTRILPAIAEQLITETARCGHTKPRRPVAGHSWSER